MGENCFSCRGEKVKLILLNLLIMLLMVFVYAIFIRKHTSLTKYNSELIASLGVLAIIVCNIFPITIIPGEIFGLEFVPFLIASLYGGPKTANYVLFASITLNIFILHEAIMMNLFLSLLMLVIVLYVVLPIYEKLPMFRKIILSMVSIILFSIVKAMMVLPVTVVLKQGLSDLVLYTGVQAFSVGFLVVICEYIKQTRLLQNKYYESEKLRVVSELAASVSHEVRNPLTVTKGFLQLLRDDLIDESRRTEFLTLSLQELDRAEEIISDYLTFAKPYDMSKLRQLKMKEELEYVIKVTKPFAAYHGIEIVYEGSTDHVVIGDQQKFRQCLLNIIKNCIEATAYGGNLSICLEEAVKEVVISIKDNGVGMSKDQIERLGLPYHSTKEKGTGLGMMVVYSIVRSMNGKVEVESELGVGTTFRLIFPCTSPLLPSGKSQLCYGSDSNPASY